MKSKIYSNLLLAIMGLIFIPAVYADYFLPYPSYMPGNKLYTVSRIIDKAKEYWYYGNIAKTKYHMGLSDKYLVEAKTLFEYKQYLLAIDALERSSDQTERVAHYISAAKKQGKDVSQLKELTTSGLRLHKNFLQTISEDLPREFIWRPEKSEEQLLPLHKLLLEAINIRQTMIDIIVNI